MPADNLDDLFRQQLGQHATPPGPDLQRRLAELAEAERLDALFRTGLGSHASQSRREVWERLEDEHLRPRPQRRRGVVAWWQLSAAAVLLLTLLAGGLWRAGYFSQTRGELVTSRVSAHRSHRQPSPASATGNEASPPQASTHTLREKPSQQPMAHLDVAVEEKNQKKYSTQATASVASSSSNPIATTTRSHRAATMPLASSRYPKQGQLPDAAAGQLATTRRRNSPAGQPLPTSAEAPAMPTTRPNPSPAVVAMTSPPEIIEVEVRRGPELSRPAAAPVVAAADEGPVRRSRLRLGGLLRQAGHLVHGEPVSLAEATGLAETVTVQARVGGRTLSKTIQL